MPILESFQVDQCSVNAFRVSYLLAAAAGLTLGAYRLRTVGFGRLRPVGWLALVIIGGVLGAGLFWLLLGLLLQFAGVHPPGTWTQGSTIIGGITLGAITGVAICVRHSIPVGLFFDRFIPGLALGQSIGRLGCFMAGCCSGRPTESWLGMHVPGPSGIEVFRYPTQIFSSLANLGIFAVLMVVDRRMAGKTGEPAAAWFPGSLTLLYLTLYFIKRFGMEFLRDEQLIGWGPFTWAHAASLLGLAVVAVLWLANRRRSAGVSPAENR